ncbi:hypothetical protein DsansV1_C61g0267531 [Dioscorea sansibarensis]
MNPIVGPERLLYATEKTSKESSSASCVGICPTNMLWERSKLSISLNLDNVAGMGPVNRLLDKFKAWSQVISPMFFGIFPSNLFPDKSNPDK